LAPSTHEIARRQQWGEGIQRCLGGLARRQHQPDDARRLQGRHHVLEGDTGEMPGFSCDGLAHVMAAIGDCDPDPLARQPPRHVAAHATESDNSEFHTWLLICSGWLAWRINRARAIA